MPYTYFWFTFEFFAFEIDEYMNLNNDIRLKKFGLFFNFPNEDIGFWIECMNHI